MNNITKKKKSDNWYVFYLKSRCEKKVSEKLTNKNIPHYLPLVKIFKKWSDRFVTVEEPLIKGYIFIPSNIIDEGKMIYVDGIVNIVKFKGKNAIVHNNEIMLLQDFLGDYTIEKYEIQSIDIGTQIEVRRGIFCGKKGQVLDINNNIAKIQLQEIGIQMNLYVKVIDLKT